MTKFSTLEAPVPFPSLITAKFGLREYTHSLRLQTKSHPYRFIVLPLTGKKTQILLHFQIQHSVVAPPSGAETKLNADT